MTVGLLSKLLNHVMIVKHTVFNSSKTCHLKSLWKNIKNYASYDIILQW